MEHPSSDAKLGSGSGETVGGRGRDLGEPGDASAGSSVQAPVTSAGSPAKLRKAVALHYDPGGTSVPQVVASGKGRLAERIIEIAKERGIAIREDPDLVELLARLDVDRHIPEPLFPAVAELLAFVYRVNRRAAPEANRPDVS